jgi:hypothetical protein
MAQSEPDGVIKFVTHHSTDGITRSEIAHSESDECDAQNHEEQANESFNQKLYHRHLLY